MAGPWGTGPYKLVEGYSTPDKHADRVVFEANTADWNPTRMPRLQRIVFDYTLGQKEAVERVKTAEGQVDLVSELSPLETLRVAESPFAQVVKNRGALMTVFGFFNMRKVDSLWRDLRLRQAVNLAINREDLIRYAAKGNGEIIPALVPRQGFGYDPDLPAYPFEPGQARQLLHDAGYPTDRAVTLIASEDLAIQATVIGKMLEQVGLTVELQLLDQVAFNQQIQVSAPELLPEHRGWDIAVTSWLDVFNFPLLQIYHYFALDGPYAWISEQPELRQLNAQVLRTTDRVQQQAVIRQMERHTRDQAYFLFLYHPIQLYAVNKAVAFVPYVNMLNLAETTVTEQHWSVRK
jgi:peptide/nickel transport system substrate-binding protein